MAENQGAKLYGQVKRLEVASAVFARVLPQKRPPPLASTCAMFTCIDGQVVELLAAQDGTVFLGGDVEVFIDGGCFTILC